jgi:hypothetical protein
MGGLKTHKFLKKQLYINVIPDKTQLLEHKFKNPTTYKLLAYLNFKINYLKIFANHK